MSEKRLLGWEPREVHTHEYDGDRLVRTVVTRESEWDDVERDKMQALAEYEAGVCGCGLHSSLADIDPDLQLTPRTCPVCAGVSQRMRQISAEDKEAARQLGEHRDPATAQPDDGRYFTLRPKPPAPGG